jgi:ribonuclease HI
MSPSLTAEIYTDGSCHTQKCVGAWASVILMDEIVVKNLGEVVFDTTHNRMEIEAVVASLTYIQIHFPLVSKIKVVSDSQYVVGLTSRRPKFIKQYFKTKAGLPIRNLDLVEQLFALLDILNVQFIKVKAHEKQGVDVNYNIEVDKRCRLMVRQAINQV